LAEELKLDINETDGIPESYSRSKDKVAFKSTLIEKQELSHIQRIKVCRNISIPEIPSNLDEF